MLVSYLVGHVPVYFCKKENTKPKVFFTHPLCRAGLRPNDHAILNPSPKREREKFKEQRLEGDQIIYSHPY